MATELAVLRIKANNLGSVSEVKDFLIDFENAYNSLYAFGFLIELLDQEFIRNRKFGNPPYKAGGTDIYFKGGLLPNLYELEGLLKIQNVMLPKEQLILSKVNIQSPGFWEFVGSLNPLQQIREFLNDRHERVKDKAYRNRQEKTIGDLEILEKENGIIKQKIDLLKSLGYSDLELRPLVTKFITDPLRRLGSYQDMELIQSSTEDTQYLIDDENELGSDQNI